MNLVAIRSGSVGAGVGKVDALRRRQLGQRPHGHPCGAFRLVWLRLFRPRRARNVHMDPRQVPGKFLDEQCAGDGAPGAATGIGEIGDFALEQLLVVIEHRHWP